MRIREHKLLTESGGELGGSWGGGGWMEGLKYHKILPAINFLSLVFN